MGTNLSTEMNWKNLPESSFDPESSWKRVVRCSETFVVDFDVSLNPQSESPLVISPLKNTLLNAVDSDWLRDDGTRMFVTDLTLSAWYNPSGMSFDVEILLVDDTEVKKDEKRKEITRLRATLEPSTRFVSPRNLLYANQLQDHVYNFVYEADNLNPELSSSLVLKDGVVGPIKTSSVFYYTLARRHTDFLRDLGLQIKDAKDLETFEQYQVRPHNGGPNSKMSSKEVEYTQMHAKGIEAFIQWLRRSVYAPNQFLSPEHSTISLHAPSHLQKPSQCDSLQQFFRDHDRRKFGSYRESGSRITVSCEFVLDFLVIRKNNRAEAEKVARVFN